MLHICVCLELGGHVFLIATPPLYAVPYALVLPAKSVKRTVVFEVAEVRIDIEKCEL